MTALQAKLSEIEAYFENDDSSALIRHLCEALRVASEGLDDIADFQGGSCDKVVLLIQADGYKERAERARAKVLEILEGENSAPKPAPPTMTELEKAAEAYLNGDECRCEMRDSFEAGARFILSHEALALVTRTLRSLNVQAIVNGTQGQGAVTEKIGKALTALDKLRYLPKQQANANT